MYCQCNGATTQKQENMELSLNRKFTGYYSKKVGSIEVVVSKCSKGWEGTITNDDNEDYIIYKVYGETKSEVSNMIVKELTK